ncbi:MAG: DUF5916 domain-containing protein [Luteibacter sp.]|uniref:DUF5916 domain-containing protein n=1 Tax=Luteibacter sp. TaxID=1886636 RepID=UPI002806EF8D|nr:DUF5916 domain-containing protein [Luteibacter sp.]MDQ7996009.1 DUF5916 domain-containing protein [Luteibacter sp.]MDQ8048774.1 DUF5916 domain-containing protein [Luteibacter sp.]
MYRRLALFATLLFATTAAHAEVTIDGHIDPAEWAGAKRITDFRDTQPMNGKPGSQPTEAWVMSTPKGLAVAIRVTQSADIPRSRQQTRRDEDAMVDRVNVMVDFDADGRVGYDFEVRSQGGVADEVITNESDFSYDWDGRWDHAVSEDADGYSVEILIPWYIAPMRKASGDTRTIGLYVDRVIAATGERMAWPAIAFDRGRFLSSFQRIEVPAYSQSLFAITPYVVGNVDRAHGGTSFEQGADILWKPNGQTQLTATINPDFGQVESDDLVVNFSPEETFFTDKRPFFTENQGIFDFSLLDDYSQLVYTRRVGGAADDGNGAADISTAVKVNGSVGSTSYGILAAQEKGDAGRTFGAFRLLQNAGTQSFGLLATRVNHPYLDRDANVLGLDHRWQPNERFTITSNVVGSKIDQPRNNSDGLGATSIAFWEMNDVWSQQWLGMYFGKRLDIDDFGYLPRSDMEYLHWEVRQRQANLPADSAYASHLWRYRISEQKNTEGVVVRQRLRIQRNSQRRDGGDELWRLDAFTAAYDDLLTRGGNNQHTPPTAKLTYDRTRPRIGRWAWEAEGFVSGNQLTGYHRLGYYFKFTPTYFVTDAFSVFAGASYEWDPNWLIWQHDNLVGAYDGRTVGLDSGLNWNLGNKQELRVKLQTLAVGAKLRRRLEITPTGAAVDSDEPVDGLGVANLGFQIRYRYEIAPLSNLYVVYNRGGYAEDTDDELDGQFRRGFGLKDVEEGLIKVAYRLEF